MLRFVVLTTLLAGAFAGSYGNYGSSGLSTGYLRAVPLGTTYNTGGLIPAAIQSRRSLSFVDIPSTYSAPAPLTVDVPASELPVNFRMRSKSSPLNLETIHEGGSGSYGESYSVDAPHVRAHTVQRPLLQKVNEIITPYRQIRQEIQPVQESVEQVVARGYAQPQQQLQLVRLVQQPLLATGGYSRGGY